MTLEIPQEILDRATVFKGNGRRLEMALGAYALGQLYGWRAVYMIHTQATCRNLEVVLGAPLSELCPERTSLTDRCLGVRTADRIGSFWNVVRRSEYATDRALLTGGDDEQLPIL